MQKYIGSFLNVDFFLTRSLTNIQKKTHTERKRGFDNPKSSQLFMGWFKLTL